MEFRQKEDPISHDESTEFWQENNMNLEAYFAALEQENRRYIPICLYVYRIRTGTWKDVKVIVSRRSVPVRTHRVLRCVVHIALPGRSSAERS
jgi:hypothetical protein